MHRSSLFPLAALIGAAAVPYVFSQTKIRASDLVVNGESFFAASNITSELTRLARQDGYINTNESFRQVAVSGAGITPIMNQYKNANPKPVYLISDGGGIDMMQSCGGAPTLNCAVIKNTLNTVQQYFGEMKTGGTKKVIWMRYPDPQGSQWATLKANHDVYNPEVEKICKASVEPKCLWVDLRPVWQGNYSAYTEDGIHCTNAGGAASAVAFWKAIKDNDFFNLEASTGLWDMPNPAMSAFRGQVVANQSLMLSLLLPQPAQVAMRLSTVSGRTILNATPQEVRSGLNTVRFPLGRVAPGIYRLNVQAGQATKQSILHVP